MSSTETISRVAFDEMTFAYRKSIRVRNAACEDEEKAQLALRIAQREITALKARIAALEHAAGIDPFADD